MPRRCWPCATAFLFIILLGFGIGRVIPQAHVLRFSDTLPAQDASQPTAFAVLPVSEPEAPAVSANSWLMHNGWKQGWPLRLLGAGAPLFFAGPPTQRYLRLSADHDYYIWTRQIDVDPHEHPALELTWVSSTFPKEPRWMSTTAPIARSSC